MSHLPATSSGRTIIQYAQQKASGRFQHYDFGTNGNMAKYGTSRSPTYDVRRIQVPIALYWGPNDFLSGAEVSISS